MGTALTSLSYDSWRNVSKWLPEVLSAMETDRLLPMKRESTNREIQLDRERLVDDTYSVLVHSELNL